MTKTPKNRVSFKEVEKDGSDSELDLLEVNSISSKKIKKEKKEKKSKETKSKQKVKKEKRSKKLKKKKKETTKKQEEINLLEIEVSPTAAIIQDTRRWEDDETNKKLKRGKFEPEETEKLMHAICQYIRETNKTENGIYSHNKNNFNFQ